jgi:hypothetical protein
MGKYPLSATKAAAGAVGMTAAGCTADPYGLKKLGLKFFCHEHRITIAGLSLQKGSDGEVKRKSRQQDFVVNPGEIKRTFDESQKSFDEYAAAKKRWVKLWNALHASNEHRVREGQSRESISAVEAELAALRSLWVKYEKPCSNLGMKLPNGPLSCKQACLKPLKTCWGSSYKKRCPAWSPGTYKAGANQNTALTSSIKSSVCDGELADEENKFEHVRRISLHRDDLSLREAKEGTVKYCRTQVWIPNAIKKNFEATEAAVEQINKQIGQPAAV